MVIPTNPAIRIRNTDDFFLIDCVHFCESPAGTLRSVLYLVHIVFGIKSQSYLEND